MNIATLPVLFEEHSTLTQLLTVPPYEILLCLPPIHVLPMSKYYDFLC